MSDGLSDSKNLLLRQQLTDRSPKMRLSVLRVASPLTEEYVSTEHVRISGVPQPLKMHVKFVKGESDGCIIVPEFSLDEKNWYALGKEQAAGVIVENTMCFPESQNIIFLFPSIAPQLFDVEFMRFKAKAIVSEHASHESTKGTSLEIHIS